MKITTKENLFLAMKQNNKSIESLGVKRLGLFGSFVREEQKRNSDIDLIVEFEKDKKTFDNYTWLLRS